ncbi:hypothetical protein [Streptomyces sp. NPDC015125]|uniref:hypothetical protein n=1 Tax=Streptomyces sp. NPDC015125 TaxID=3364938 RepID=UPI0036FEF6E0
MTETPAEAIATYAGSTLRAIDDPIQRYEDSKRAEVSFDAELRDLRREIAIELKREQGKTWREIGEAMGGVSPQRAEQISRGV